MTVQILKSKILRATVTESRLDYEGSLGIDADFMKMVGLLNGEKILVGNISTGTRFETYAIPAPSGSKTFSLRGAAAHLGKAGDLIVIMSFANMSIEEAQNWVPHTMTLGDNNNTIIKQQNIFKL